MALSELAFKDKKETNVALLNLPLWMDQGCSLTTESHPIRPMNQASK